MGRFSVESSPKVNSVTGVPEALGPNEPLTPPNPRDIPAAHNTVVDPPGRRIGQWLDRASQPFLALTFDGRITFANRAFELMIGYPGSELYGMTIRDITPPRWHSTSEVALEHLRNTGRSQRYEKEYRHRDGHLVPIEATVDLDHDEQGNPVGFYAFVTDVSERKQFEVALRASEERFRRLYDEAPVGYHEIDLEGRIVSINRTECEMLGYAREELLGRPYFDWIAEELREEASKAFAEKIRGLRPLRNLERTVVTRDGRRLIVSFEEAFKRDDEGRVCGIRSTLQDITERKRTEAALVASERRARALFEGIDDALFVHAPDGRILDANPAATRLLGYSHDELLAMRTTDIDDPEFAAGFESRLREQLATGRLKCEGQHRAKDGRIIPVEINTSTVIVDGERAILAVIRDVTERRALDETRRQLAEEQARNAREMEAKNRALTESEARYRQFTEGCLDAVIVVDHRGLIVLYNPAAERTFGYPAAEVLGRPIAHLMPNEFGQISQNDFEHHLCTRVPSLVGRTVELGGRRKGGEEFPLELSLSAIDFAGDRQFIGSIRDQTERQRMRAMLAQSERLASIGLLSAGVAHEINNPLAYVANNLAVLERDMAGILEIIAAYESANGLLASGAPDVLRTVESLAEELDWSYVRDNLHRMLERTREGVQRVADIVQNLRGLARTSPPKMEPMSIPDLLDSALEMLRGRLRRNRIEVDVAPCKLPRIVCVGPQISQVILNLLINATQAIESAGRTEGGRIRFQAERAGEMAVLSIFDNGCGISDESMPHLFDPFFTTKPVGEGTGLGLSISHGIVSGHGGRIEVESRPGSETCFRVFLPLKRS
jgi:PAS domain S-box-containing protein